MSSSNATQNTDGAPACWIPDRQNNMGIPTLHEDQEELPPHVRVVRDGVRKACRRIVQPDPDRQTVLPPFPQNAIRTVEDLFTRAYAAVDETWTSAGVDALIQGLCEEWKGQLTEECADLRAALENAPKVVQAVRNRFMGTLEELRSALPDAWDTLLALASERQIHAQAVLRSWIRHIPATAEQELGCTRAELQLFLDCTSLQKFMDHAYIKQRALADREGGSNATKLGKGTETQAAAQWIYEVVPEDEDQYSFASDTCKEDRIVTKGFGDMFPFEWTRMTKKFIWLIERTQKKIDGGLLPQYYTKFVEYLRALHKFYQAQENIKPDHDPRKLDQMMKEAFQAGMEAYRQGCKLTLIPEATPSIAGDANKQDIGMRFGIVTPELQRYNHTIAESQSNALKWYVDLIGEQEQELLSAPPCISPVLPSVEMVGAGCNLHFRVGGTNDLGRADVHPNFIRKEAEEEFALLTALFPGLKDTDDNAYQNEALEHYVNHEQGHSICPLEDPKVCTRIGYGDNSDDGWILEELKAEAASAMIRKIGLEKQSSSSNRWNEAFAAKLGSIVTIVATSAEDGMGDRYFFSGLKLLWELMVKGIVVEEGDHYRVTDPERGLRVLAAAGDAVIREYYADPAADAEKAATFVAKVRMLKEQPRLQKFIAAAQKAED